MSSDGFFDDDDIDDAFLEELNAIEAAHFSPSKAARPVPPPTVDKDDSFELTFDFNEEDFKKVDQAVLRSYRGQSSGMSSTTTKSSTSGHLQTTLFGEVLSSSALTSKPKSATQRVQSTSRNPFGQQAPKTKYWDHTEFAKSGLKSSKNKDKGKGKASFDFPEDEGFDESPEFEQFPAPSPPSMKLSADLLEAKHWIYPLNRPKRDYQFNIVKHCLFDNTIVALPTGLGKTFVAGVVMLNFYRWFPEGKVVFVAPTKPLVAQQIDACHRTCGIPGSDAIELTGENPKPMRHRAWKEKRVFYMTPQTLVNDLTSETCDARDIILVVVDEAHRAAGNYAYNQVVRFLMAKNPHFRLLALTATPGGNPEAVQSLIDGLHISRIEIRDENSLDLKAYIHEKRVEQHIVPMSEDIVKIRTLLAHLMEIYFKPLVSRGLIHGGNVMNMHPYIFQVRMKEVREGQGWAAYRSLSILMTLARIMGYLVEGTTAMCYNALMELASGGGDVGAKKSKAASKAKQLDDEPAFHSLMRELKAQKTRGFTMHPKMELLKGIIVQHFGEKLPENSEDELPERTKVMVFATNRDSVDEIVEVLNAEKPLIRASRFIGQGTDKQGRKGFSQREQLEVIKRFKDDEFNVLVATSIGEEGLDIGEVDLIVCYDAQKTPIRMLQRLGRTGRKRAGVVHVLLSEGREEFNLDKAKDTYKNVQKTIWQGDQLQLYADVERLLPDHITPQCLEKTMEIQEYIRVDGRKKSLCEGPQRGTKRKRDDNIQRNIPPGASTGFVPVRDLVVKGAQKKKKRVEPFRDLETAGQDDDTDRELELGMLALKRSKSTAEAFVSRSTKGKGKLRKAKTMEDGPKRKKRKQVAEPTSSQGMDDSDDMDIEEGLYPSSKPISPPPLPYPETTAGSVVDLTDSDSDDPRSDVAHVHRLHSPKSASSNRDMSWLVDNDDDVAFDIISSSPPVQSTPKIIHQGFSGDDDSVEIVDSDAASSDLAYSHKLAIDADESAQIIEMKSRTRNLQHKRTKFIATGKESIQILNSSTRSPKFVVGPSSNPSSNPVSSLLATKGHGTIMSPPPVSSQILASSFGANSPQSSFPVRPSIQKGKNRARTDSPEMELAPLSQRRLHKRDKSVNKRKSEKSRPLLEGVWDMDAVHSGDEVSEGSSHSEDDVESEFDRRFLEELPETQFSQSYDQNLAYRQSLLSQGPVGGGGPVFAHRPVRRGRFGGRSIDMAERRAMLSSSPSREEEPDEYEIGSFVVDDDAEIVYD
ncbi:P-loop containing nucleoside triphosphate hydrolase protein [Guyanagaster necrorhizus]|uniref:ATP-dependent DNA helicase n=1 Tax=Guyanagaster necrorhizus TaxID=856835 RepID=A0A9P8AXU2_9AGAR|nr:P-loop containing nucleoside triphosphate hydrolase protein [Guyanagaster necrorhizus MCA 3950]KAG7450292.1 P-loop containing nucleoside triphosphate hydrolase protein [Guyanagaster necrorhizus MCA 3950]